ncbi:MAG: hypothetical protein ACMUIA_04440 [bacterium]
MPYENTLFSRRDFLRRSSALLTSLGAITVGCRAQNSPSDGKSPHIPSPDDDKHAQSLARQEIAEINPWSWWREGGYIIHETVDTGRISEGIIRARVDGSWQEFRVIELPERFLNWSLRMRKERLERMIRAGGMDPRDLAGSHNACVATYGGPRRDSSVSINTAYKGMGFTVRTDRLGQAIEKIHGERLRIERETRGDPAGELYAKAQFLARFYNHVSSFDRTKQVSLELFTSPTFHTHTFLNMMTNPITSASFLSFPTFEIRAVAQLLHPKNPNLSKGEKEMITYTNAIHDFIHSGPGERITCIYHIIELFDDTPNDLSKGKRIAATQRPTSFT